MGVVQSAGNAFSAATITTTLPAAPTVGNTVVAIANSDSTLTIAGTWNLRRSFVSDQGFYVWDKVAGASESPSVSVSPDGGADHAALIVVELDGVSDFDEVGVVGSAHGAASNITAPNVATSADNDVALAIAALHGGWDNSGHPDTPTFGNGFTAVTQAFPASVTSSAFVTGLFVGYQELGGAGDIGDTDISWLVSTSANQAGLLIAYKAGNSLSGGLGVGLNLQATVQRVAIVTGELAVDVGMTGDASQTGDIHVATGAYTVGAALDVASSKVGVGAGVQHVGIGLTAASQKVVAVTGQLDIDLSLTGRDQDAERDISITVGPPQGNWVVTAPVGQWAVNTPVSSGWSVTPGGGDWDVTAPTA